MKRAVRNTKTEGRNPKEIGRPKHETRRAPIRISDFGLLSDLGLRSSDFTLWQLADSAFPTGGFAHSAGLEAAWQHGEVRNGDELESFLEATLHQLARAALPFVTTAHAEPDRFAELDHLCDAFITNHVANRASRLQGQAFVSAVERVFKVQVPGILPTGPRYAHLAPVFGALMNQLELSRDTATRLFVFNHTRSIVAAAVRLNIIGPMEAQAIQHRFAARCEETASRGAALTLNDLAQTAPLLEIWQGTQDRLYSRLFQS